MKLSIADIEKRIRLGEDSQHQFKVKIENTISLAEELVAFSNAKGGFIFIGVDDKNVVQGVSQDDIRKLNNLVSNACSENVIPPIHVTTVLEEIDEKIVFIIEVEEGLQKPYCTKQGKYLTKSGADKRILSQAELSRLLQESGSFHTEELPIRGANVEQELDKSTFYVYYETKFKQNIFEHLEQQKITIAQLLDNLKLAYKNELTLTGLLFFSKNPQLFQPTFIVKAVSFYGNDITDTKYLSSDDITGTLERQFRFSMDFLKSNLLKLQNKQGFNSQGELEISEIALEELIMNALIHRDYSRNAPIRLFIFQNRIEIISPGVLPNHLTTENVKMGVAVPRNPIITKFASELLPYRGIGSGVFRALQLHPDIELYNEVETQQFKVIIPRKHS